MARFWQTTPEVGSSRLPNGLNVENPAWKINTVPATYPEVFRQIHLNGVLWTYQFEADEPPAKKHHHKRASSKPDDFLSFTELELAVKEYVVHDNIAPLAQYLATVSDRKFKEILDRCGLTTERPCSSPKPSSSVRS